MKIGIYGFEEIPAGKKNVKDSRLDEIDAYVMAKKRTYVQVELVTGDAVVDCDAILVLKESRADLILKDLEFVETRIARAEQEAEKAVLGKLKAALEKEELILRCGLNDEEKKLISGYVLFTNKPVAAAEKQELDNLDALLAKVLKESGYISFFTGGEKEARAWLIRSGTTAHEAAGAIHSDIQKGFIRAEVIGYNDFIALGGENNAKQAGKMRLEQKDYIMQDADIVNFRFNK